MLFLLILFVAFSFFFFNFGWILLTIIHYKIGKETTMSYAIRKSLVVCGICFIVSMPIFDILAVEPTVVDTIIGTLFFVLPYFFCLIKLRKHRRNQGKF